MDRLRIGVTLALLTVAATWAVSSPSPAATGGDSVLLTEVEGPITPVIAGHLEAAVAEADARGVPVVVRLDTPGGLDQSMRDIIQSFLNAPVPVVVYVAPEGARAASAGTFITMAAHVAAMAPATSIGAATPVDMQGGEITDKILNDAASFAISVAERRGRDTAFAEEAVRDGRSVTGREAVEIGAVDLTADNLDDLLEAIDSRVVATTAGDVALATAGARVERFEMSTTRRVLAQIADPNLAFLLLSFGTLAIVYEAANPGVGFAGIAGLIALIVGFFALSVLPVTTAGIALLILAMALFIGEVFVPGVGVLAGGGTIALILSGFFLFDGPLRVAAPVLWPTGLVLGLGTALAGRAAIKARFAPSTTGPHTLVGEIVDVEATAENRGDTFVDGAWWSVRATDGELQTGKAEVVAVDGLQLVVRPIGEEDES